ncbi:MAG: endo-1,4-beta-xylanase [Chitinophagaceae bacterium]
MKKIVFIALAILQNAIAFSQTKLDSIWNDPEIEQRIRTGIEQNRMGNFSIEVPAYKGKTEIEIQQVKQEFLFGANAFMIKGFDTPEQNKRFEDLFASLFNQAVIPYYWKTLEPVQGKPRYTAASEPSYRRPPPDVVLEFCKQYGITPKGHTLVWNNPTHAVPDWMPKDTAAIEQFIVKRITELGQRYGNSIHTWDIVNEVLSYFPNVIMPKDYVYKSFQAAAKAYPADTKFILNEATHLWQNTYQEYSPFYMLIQNLLLRNCKIDAIGMQFHFFNEQLFKDAVAGNAMTPKQLFAILDLYAAFKKPIQISEITIPTLPNNEEGRKNQAILTRNYYRLWFSHPSVESIIWWNSVDGTAVKGEDKWNGGFVNNDFSPKPSYDVLNNLINKEWKTNITTSISNSNSYAFKGFYGEYRIKIKQGKKVTEQRIIFSKTGQRSASIQ